MPWQVTFHNEFYPEFQALPQPVQDTLLAHLIVLRDIGPALGRPLVDTLHSSRVANLKEMRFDAEGGVWRVLFAFDRKRIAVLLAGGNKKGAQQKRFYDKLIATAEARYGT